MSALAFVALVAWYERGRVASLATRLANALGRERARQLDARKRATLARDARDKRESYARALARIERDVDAEAREYAMCALKYGHDNARTIRASVRARHVSSVANVMHAFATRADVIT